MCLTLQPVTSIADPSITAQRDETLEFAQSSIGPFLGFRLTTHDQSVDQVIREYLKVICGSRELNERIDSLALDLLLPLETYSGSALVGCGCLSFDNTEHNHVCGKAWLAPGEWRDKQ